MPYVRNGGSVSLHYHRLSKRWVLSADEGQLQLILRCASFDHFFRSAKRLSSDELKLLLNCLRCHSDKGSKAFETLLLYLYVLIHLRRGRTSATAIFTRPSWHRFCAVVTDLCAPGARIRRRHLAYATELARVAKQVPSTSLPLTSWRIASDDGLSTESKQRHLETVLRRCRTHPPEDEASILACWAASREFLALATEAHSPKQVRDALGYYKRFISGRHAHFVGRVFLSKVARVDLLDLCEKYPAYLEIERTDREFLENWFLARFSNWLAMKVAFPRRSKLVRVVFLLGLVTVSSIVALTLLGWPRGLPQMDWECRLLAEMGPLLLVVLMFLWRPEAFGLIYPRLFAGAVFGWTAVLAGIGSETLFAQTEDVQSFTSDLLRFSMPLSTSILFGFLALLPLFFLYQQAFSAIGMRWPALRRTLLVFVLLLAMNGMVGLVFLHGLEPLLCRGEAAQCFALRQRLLFAGIFISNYFAVIMQLLWIDEGISSTLAGRGYPNRMSA